MSSSESVARNRAWWDRSSDDYKSAERLPAEEIWKAHKTG